MHTICHAHVPAKVAAQVTPLTAVVVFPARTLLRMTLALAIRAVLLGSLLLCSGWASANSRDVRHTFLQFLPEQGLSQSQVQCILQDSDGYLWVGTRSGGLNRYDGYSFKNFRSPDGLHAAQIRALLELRGTLYVGTRQGLYRREGDRFVQVPHTLRSTPDITGLAADTTGALLVSSDVGLLELAEGKLIASPRTEAFANSRLGEVRLGPDGRIWLRSRGTLGFLRDGQFQRVDLQGHTGLLSLGISAAGDVLVGTQDGILRVNELHAEPAFSELPQLSTAITTLFSARDGSWWIGTREELYHWVAGQLELLDAQAGFPGSSVKAMLEDREGNLFFGTDGHGLVQLPRQPFRAFAIGRLVDYAPMSMIQDDWKRRWIATFGQGLWVVDQGQAQLIGPEQGLATPDCLSLMMMDPTTLWVGTSTGLYEVTIERAPYKARLVQTPESSYVLDMVTVGELRLVASEAGLWRHYQGEWRSYLPPAIPTTALYDLELLPDGTVWVGTQDQGAFRWDPVQEKIVEFLGQEEGLPAQFVLTLHQQGETLWVGTEQGLLEKRPGSVKVHTSKDGLPDDTVSFVTHAPDGALWVGTNRGIATREGTSWRTYTHHQGLPSDETNSGAALWDEQQRLWAGTLHGWAVQTVYPPLRNDVTPLIQFEQIWQDDQRLDPLSRPVLPYYKNRLRFLFVGISLTDPNRVRYRYRLAGLEDTWTETSLREVRYPALPPGDYELEVLACNNDGVWASTPASFRFEIEGPWWERWWARALQILAIFLSGGGYWAWRMRSIRRRAQWLEIQVAERTRELVEEKEKSERLLLNILPAPIANELRDHGVATTRLYDDVTILFTDFQDFTRTCATLAPERLVDELNEIFAVFDDICREHRLEKLKTIGDAFMAAGGLPSPSDTHPVDAVEAAIEMQEYLTGRNTHPDKIPFKLRIGIHTGPVVAGVIGKWKFAYDIWGDAVNTASRMESSGAAGEINISRTTFDRVRHVFACEARGQVVARGKGALEMFFIRGRK